MAKPPIWLFLALLVIAANSLTGCQTAPQGHAPPDPANEVHRQLIWLKLDDLLPLEQTQRYAALFDQLMLPEVERPGRRAQFLKLTKCAEVQLGQVLQFSRSKATLKYNAPKQVYTVTLPVSRLNANVLEQWTFAITPDGSLQWTGLHWLTNRSDFLTCAADVPGLAVHQPVHGAKLTPPPKAKKPETDKKPVDVLPRKRSTWVNRVKQVITHPIASVVKAVKHRKRKDTDTATTPPAENMPSPTPMHDSDAPLSHTEKKQQDGNH